MRMGFKSKLKDGSLNSGDPSPPPHSSKTTKIFVQRNGMFSFERMSHFLLCRYQVDSQSRRSSIVEAY